MTDEERLKELTIELTDLAHQISDLNNRLRPLERRFEQVSNEKYDIERRLVGITKVASKRSIRIGKTVSERWVDLDAEIKQLIANVTKGVQK